MANSNGCCNVFTWVTFGLRCALFWMAITVVFCKIKLTWSSFGSGSLIIANEVPFHLHCFHANALQFSTCQNKKMVIYPVRFGFSHWLLTYDDSLCWPWALSTPHDKPTHIRHLNFYAINSIRSHYVWNSLDYIVRCSTRKPCNLIPVQAFRTAMVQQLCTVLTLSKNLNFISMNLIACNTITECESEREKTRGV